MPPHACLSMWLLAVILIELLSAEPILASSTPVSTPAALSTTDTAQCGPLSCRALIVLSVIAASTILLVVLVAALVASNCCHQCGDETDDDEDVEEPLLRSRFGGSGWRYHNDDEDNDDDDDASNELPTWTHRCLHRLRRFRSKCQLCLWRLCQCPRNGASSAMHSSEESGDASIDGGTAGRDVADTSRCVSHGAASTSRLGDEDEDDGLVLVLPALRTLAARTVLPDTARACAAKDAAFATENLPPLTTPTPPWMPSAATKATGSAGSFHDRLDQVHSSSSSQDGGDEPVQPMQPTIRSGSATVSVSSRSSCLTAHHEEPQPLTATRKESSLSKPSSSNEVASGEPLQPEQPQQPVQPRPLGFYWPREVKLDANFKPTRDAPEQPVQLSSLEQPPQHASSSQTVLPPAGHCVSSLSTSSSVLTTTTNTIPASTTGSPSLSYHAQQNRIAVPSSASSRHSWGGSRRRAHFSEPWQPVVVTTPILPSKEASTDTPQAPRGQGCQCTQEGVVPSQPRVESVESVSAVPTFTTTTSAAPYQPEVAVPVTTNALLDDDLMYCGDGVYEPVADVAMSHRGDFRVYRDSTTESAASFSSSNTSAEQGRHSVLMSAPHVSDAQPASEDTAVNATVPSVGGDFLMDDLSLAAMDAAMISTSQPITTWAAGTASYAVSSSASPAIPAGQVSADGRGGSEEGVASDLRDVDNASPQSVRPSSLHIFSGSTTSASSVDTLHPHTQHIPLVDTRGPGMTECVSGLGASAVTTASVPHTPDPSQRAVVPRDTVSGGIDSRPDGSQSGVCASSSPYMPIGNSGSNMVNLSAHARSPPRLGARSAKAHHRQREGVFGSSWVAAQRVAPGLDSHAGSATATTGFVHSVDPRFYGAATHETLFAAATNTTLTPRGEASEAAPGLFLSTSVGGFGRTSSLTSQGASPSNRMDADATDDRDQSSRPHSKERGVHTSSHNAWQFPWSDGAGGYRRRHSQLSRSASSASSLVSGGSASTAVPMAGSHGTASEPLGVSTPSATSDVPNGMTLHSHSSESHRSSLHRHAESPQVIPDSDIPEKDCYRSAATAHLDDDDDLDEL